MTSDNTSYQMLWDCGYCGSAKLLGLDHKHCPNCGGAQDPDARYFPDEGEEVAVADHQFVGADKLCPACRAPSGALATFCGGCGCGLDEAAEVKRRADRVGSGQEGPAGDSAAAARQEHRDTKQAAEQAATAGASRSSSGGFLKILIIFAVLGGSFFLLLQIMKKEVALEVTGHGWERSIAVEQLKTVTDKAWMDEVPKNAGARIGSCARQKRSEKDVPDGEDCVSTQIDQGDGTFKKGEKCTPRFKKVPVHDQMCSYQVDRWENLRTEVRKGSSTADVGWPAVVLVRAGDCVGCQREGERKASYSVVLKETESGASYTADCPEDRWRSISAGERFAATAMRGASKLKCDSLQPPE